MNSIVEVKATIGRDGSEEQAVLACSDPEGVLRATPGDEVRNLWEKFGPGWWQAGDEAFAAPYALGEGWQGQAEFTALTHVAAGAEYTGEWRLGAGEEVGALWQAERVRKFVDGKWRDLWEVYIAPGDMTTGLEHDIVGLRRLALPMTVWLDTQPEVGGSVSFGADNLFVGRPPAPNWYPMLRGWGERSIYELMRLTRRAAF